MPNNAVGMMTFAESKHWSLSLFEATDLTTFFCTTSKEKSKSNSSKSVSKPIQTNAISWPLS